MSALNKMAAPASTDAAYSNAVKEHRMDHDTIAFHMSDRVFAARSAMNDLASHINECSDEKALEETYHGVKEIAEIAARRLLQIQHRVSEVWNLSLPVAS